MLQYLQSVFRKLRWCLISPLLMLHRTNNERSLTVKYARTALMIAIAAGSLSTAHVAQAGDVVSFKLKAFELESAGGRTKLLARIRSKAWSECSDRSSVFNHDRDACKQDLQTQWIDAIGDSRLAALVIKGKDNLASAAN
jgi:UrcA family protein